MKIGLFTDSYVPRTDGIAIATDILKRGLSQLGHEVFVFCPSRPGVKPSKDIITYPSVPALLVYEGLRAAWPFGRGRLAQIRRLELDLIHIHLPFMVGFAGLRAARKLDLPLVMTCHQDLDLIKDYHGSIFGLLAMAVSVGFFSADPVGLAQLLIGHKNDHHLSWKDDFARRTYTFLTDHCDLVVAPSHKIYSQLAPYSKRHNFAVVPNGIRSDLLSPLSRAEARHKIGIPIGATVAITTSRLVREKRIDVVIRAFAEASAGRPEACLIVVGDGPERKSLEKLAKELGIKTTFTGNLAQPEVFQYLAATDIYLNACLREVASLSAMEAAAAGLPIVVSDSRLAELLIDGETGFFATTDKDLIKKLSLLLGDSKLRQRLGKKAKAHILRRHSLRAHAEAIAVAYHRLELESPN